jgi:hypothetical protein
MSASQLTLLFLFGLFILSIVVMFVDYHWGVELEEWEEELQDWYSELAAEAYADWDEFNEADARYRSAVKLHSYLAPQWLIPLENRMFGG